MEVEIEQAKSMKIDFAECRKLMLNGPDFITKNYYWTSKRNTKRYKLYIVRQESKSYYVLPVKNVNNVIECVQPEKLELAIL